MRLLELPDAALELIAAGALSEGHGRALLLAGDQDERLALARTAVKRGLSVRDTEAAAQEARQAQGRRQRAEDRARWTRSSRTSPSTRPGSRSSCGQRCDRVRAGGTVEIRFSSPAELGRIIDQLRAERVSWAD